MDEVKLPKGVSFDKNRRIKKYKSIIKLNGRTKHLGYWRTSEEAHQAYLKALMEKTNNNDATK